MDNKGILETVMNSQAAEALRNFDPHGQVLRFLEKQLAPREYKILTARYGLSQDQEPLTLEQIGKQTSLTRERVRQIEKSVIRRLQAAEMPPDLHQGVDLIFQVLEEHGNIMRENRLFQFLLQPDESGNPLGANAVTFILHLVPSFNFLKESERLHRAWHLAGFDRALFESVLEAAGQILTEAAAVQPAKQFFEKLRQAPRLLEEAKNLPDPVLESMVSVARRLDKNPFGQWGFSHWPAIRPHDVGDKAYLVLLHRGEPRHYSEITELINKHLFDRRTAHKETVHNELIKDKRFVLVGRGIYALSEWGFRPGVVADVVADILLQAGRPLSRDEIIAEVGKQRLVKRNTIIVGLSNRQRFIKTPDNKYLNA